MSLPLARWTPNLEAAFAAVDHVRMAAQQSGDSEIADPLTRSLVHLHDAINIFERRAKVVEPPLFPESATTGDPTK